MYTATHMNKESPACTNPVGTNQYYIAIVNGARSVSPRP